MKNITEKEWKSLISEDKHAIIIDSRRPDEWEQGIIEGAEMMDIMDFEDFQQKSKHLDLSKNYYVYCRSGVRSIRA
ncbi:MAG: rhodanese-like domain-containing protein [Polaribacter sp.]|nr:rhodanese-like domain-containing protein [Polaribacter sp.]